jgi:hypothetical protein
MDILVLKEFEDFIINSSPQFAIYSYEINSNFKLLYILRINYEKELNSILILSRKLDLIEFFNTIEKKLLYINHVFESITNKNYKIYLQKQIEDFRKLNIQNIKKYLEDS